MSNRTPSDSDLNLAMSLPAARRYAIFIQAAAAAGQVWCLNREGLWVEFEDQQGLNCVAVWPTADSANCLANGKWTGCVAMQVSMSDWLGRWLPHLEERHNHVMVFPVPKHGGSVVSARQLLADLSGAMLGKSQ